MRTVMRTNEPALLADSVEILAEVGPKVKLWDSLFLYPLPPTRYQAHNELATPGIHYLKFFSLSQFFKIRSQIIPKSRKCHLLNTSCHMYIMYIMYTINQVAELATRISEILVVRGSWPFAKQMVKYEVDGGAWLSGRARS